MRTRDDHRTRGRRRADRLTAELTTQWRDLRLAAGLTQADLGRATGLARSTSADVERGVTREIGLGRAAIISALLGQDLSVRLFPSGEPLRDAAHADLLLGFDARLSPVWRNTHESPMSQAGDLRAWDRRLDGPISIGVEAETRIRDLQALERAMHRKQRDSGVDRMVLLVRGTERNRALLRGMLPVLRATFPLTTSETLLALGAGRDPGANGLVVL